MAASDLQALLCVADLERLLTPGEQRIVELAAQGGAEAVARLNGASLPWAERQIERIKAKLEAAPSATAMRVSAGAASTPPTSPAPRPAGGSTGGGRGPSIADRVQGYLRDHAEGSQAQMTEALGCDLSRLSEVVRQLQREGKVRLTRKDGRTNMYALGEAAPAAPAPVGTPPGVRAAAEIQAALDRDIVTAIKASGGIGDLGDKPIKPIEVDGEGAHFATLDEAQRARDAELEAEINGAGRQLMRYFGVSGDVVAPPKVFIGLWDVLLADGKDWTPEHTHAYVAAARGLYAAYGGPS